jgi:hypothetical protein
MSTVSSECLSEFAEVDRFREVEIETGFETGAALLGRVSPRHRNRFQRLLLFRFADQVNPVAIRKIQIADQNIESHFLETLSRVAGVLGRDGLAPAAVQEVAEDPARICVIFDQEDEHAEYGSNRTTQAIGRHFRFRGARGVTPLALSATQREL